MVDNTRIIRPKGQIKNPNDSNPIFSESKKLDFEVEIGVIIGKSNKMGKPVKVKEAEEYIFGLVLLNDWSARDIQTWEYIPLGPFNSKNFATTISPWIITLEALEPFKISLSKQNPGPLPYLFDNDLKSWDIPITVSIKNKNEKNFHNISTTNYKYIYWSINQQIAHHTVSGCQLRVGDILGSGTISGNKKEEYGSLFELNENGKKKIKVGDNEKTWIEDNDSIKMQAEIQGDGYKIGFGNCLGEILPSNYNNEYY